MPKAAPSHAERLDQPEVRSHRNHGGDSGVEEIEPRPLHHDHGLGEADKAVRGAGERDDVEPDRALSKRGTVDAEDDRASQDHDREKGQKNPEHPLRNAREGGGGMFLFAIAVIPATNGAKMGLNAWFTLRKPLPTSTTAP